VTGKNNKKAIPIALWGLPIALWVVHSNQGIPVALWGFP